VVVRRRLRSSDYHAQEATTMKYLTHDEAAEYLRMSPRSLHDLVAKRAVPHRRPAGCRRILYDAREIDLWLDGHELESLSTAGGGRVVRVRAKAAA
jgi:excisionase family DNA binding protein